MTEQPRILIVDDEQIVRESLTNWLKEESYQVEAAENGTLALEKIRQFPFQVVLLDLKMPGMDGIQVLNGAEKRFSGHRGHHHDRLRVGQYRRRGHKSRGL